jgi:hypothetical protein
MMHFRGFDVELESALKIIPIFRHVSPFEGPIDFQALKNFRFSARVRVAAEQPYVTIAQQICLGCTLWRRNKFCAGLSL